MMEPSMAQTAREIFIVGLRNAHAMETQARELKGSYPSDP
jgi:ferritin-like metal-binding protein YciE